MSTVIRVKRSIHEEPSETLFINCKRRKTNSNEDTKSEEVGAVFQLAATSNEDHDIEHFLKKSNPLNTQKLKENFKKHLVDINEKSRSEMRNSSINNRYRIVSKSRKILNDEETQQSEAAADAAATTSTATAVIGPSEITVLDLETDSVAKESTSSENLENPISYTYDYYLTYSNDIEDADFGDMDSINYIVQEFVFDSRESVSEDESEDSNAENHRDNDYPDESDDLYDDVDSDDYNDDSSVSEDDMMRAMRNMSLDNDLSSDSNDYKNTYYIDTTDRITKYPKNNSDTDESRFGDDAEYDSSIS